MPHISYYSATKIEELGRPLFPDGEKRLDYVVNLLFPNGEKRLDSKIGFLFPRDARLMAVLKKFEPEENREEKYLCPNSNENPPTWKEIYKFFWAGLQEAIDVTEHENFKYACGNFDKMHLYFLDEYFLDKCMGKLEPLTTTPLIEAKEEGTIKHILYDVHKGGILLNEESIPYKGYKGETFPEIDHFNPKRINIQEEAFMITDDNPINRLLRIRRENIDSCAYPIPLVRINHSTGEHEKVMTSEKNPEAELKCFYTTLEEDALKVLKHYSSIIIDNMNRKENGEIPLEWRSQAERLRRKEWEENPIEYIIKREPVILGVPLVVGEEGKL